MQVEVFLVHGEDGWMLRMGADFNYRFVGWNPNRLSNVAVFMNFKDAASFAEAHDLKVVR